MSNRLLSLFVLVLIFASGYGIYYYFFVANVGNLSLIINGAESVSASITSEFQNTYTLDCKRTCVFSDIPPVNYSITVKKAGYREINTSTKLNRSESKKVVITMEKEVKLTTLPTGTGSVVLKNEGKEFVAGEYNIDDTILTTKETQDPNVEIITMDTWVCIYDATEKICTPHQLYDDIVLLPRGDILALVKKTSKAKLSLLNLADDGQDYILHINADRKNRNIVLKTPINWRFFGLTLDGKIVLVDMDGKKSLVENVN
ncbi:MAG: hypothetical protein ACD_78C00428G0002 [uncultured bacterium (gcode 4)]|uniref:PEGA domain-containing protein n=1 Tax=uncultured bacterium (gcode 4) TaxID=1234023 RepID=K1XWP3_9BACT|nr:MAG: hypothetical protein ACD_78C00428G0002 [uncultured bacterium (gcode 4)]